MNELDDLRDALHSPPDFTPRVLDLDAIMAGGGRLRTRRRVVASAAAAVSVVAVLIGGGLWAGHDRTAGSSTIAPAGPGPAPSERSTAGANPTPPSTPADDSRPLGDLIPTGMTTSAGEFVLYGIPVQEAVLPKVHFGVMLGVRKAGGSPVDVVEINETRGSDRSPGFHEGEAASNINDLDTPQFGYFVGAAARITADVKGHLVSAHLQAWSEDPQVVIFWFDLKTIKEGVSVGELTAYDRNGRKLATTKSGAGVG